MLRVIFLLSALLLTGCAGSSSPKAPVPTPSVKPPPSISLSARTFEEAHLGGSSCYTVATVQNNTKRKIRMKRLYNVFMFDNKGVQIADTIVSFNTLMLPMSKARSKKTLVAYGTTSRAICNAVDKVVFEPMR